MEMKFINAIGELFEDVFQFVFNITPGYFIMLLILTIVVIIILYFRFFGDMIQLPFKHKD